MGAWWDPRCTGLLLPHTEPEGSLLGSAIPLCQKPARWGITPKLTHRLAAGIPRNAAGGWLRLCWSQPPPCQRHPDPGAGCSSRPGSG